MLELLAAAPHNPSTYTHHPQVTFKLKDQLLALLRLAPQPPPFPQPHSQHAPPAASNQQPPPFPPQPHNQHAPPATSALQLRLSAPLVDVWVALWLHDPDTVAAVTTESRKTTLSRNQDSPKVCTTIVLGGGGAAVGCGLVRGGAWPCTLPFPCAGAPCSLHTPSHAAMGAQGWPHG